MVFVGDNALAHHVKQRLHLFCLLLCHLSEWNNEGHRLQLGNSNIGDNEEGGYHLTVFANPLADAFRLNTCCNNDENLLLVVEHIFNALQYLLYEPWLDYHTNDVGTLCSQLVAGSSRDAHIRKLVACLS